MRQTFDDHADPSFGSKHLPLIREQLRKQGLDGFLIPHEDEHQNEYLPDANERLAWATGFTGSAGAAVVMAEQGGGVRGRPLYAAGDRTRSIPPFSRCATWWKAACPLYLGDRGRRSGQVIGYDPRLHSPDALARLGDRPPPRPARR